MNYCNEHFKKTHYRKTDGRCVVKMSFKTEFFEIMLRNSNEIAFKRLDGLWQRLERATTMKNLCTEILSEYELLNDRGEIRKIKDFDEGFYRPHYGMLRPFGKTIKLRDIFDANAKIASGNHLKDLLCKGGILQKDFFSILIRLRK